MARLATAYTQYLRESLVVVVRLKLLYFRVIIKCNNSIDNFLFVHILTNIAHIYFGYSLTKLHIFFDTRLGFCRLCA